MKKGTRIKRKVCWMVKEARKRTTKKFFHSAGKQGFRKTNYAEVTR